MAVRVIVAGAGGVRGLDWVREIKSADGFHLSACVDTDEDALSKAAAAHSLSPAECFLSLDDALQAVPCDAVIIATPADLHTKACETALESGHACLVEKPFTTNLSDAVRLVHLAEDKRAPLLVAQNYRYMRAFRTARRLIQEGALGRVGLVTCQYYKVPHAMAASLSKLKHSVLWGMGVHHLDALRYVLGEKVSAALAESFTLPWGELPEGASLRVMLQMEGGARAFYSASYESSGHEFFERGQEFYARFTGERATLHLFHRWLVLCERKRLPRFIRRGRRVMSEEQVLLSQLWNAINDSHYEPEVSGRDNLQTMAVVEACLRSAAEGRWINTQELLDEAEKGAACLSHRH
ncbi:MAG: Gfo/Idh/MocA family oxidoreductase [Pyrinomonadaceae bacterium]|nr:Gfo/Idh/MocA family oxidoreductase [Pyrinomonadaceae bacterium]